MSINKYLQPVGNFVADMGNGTVGKVAVRNYQHAARIFTDADFRLSPKYGFLYYVEFDFHPSITSVSNISAQEMGMIVKSVTLPKFSIQTKEHNAYNRKNIVQNSIKYDPVTLVFHDDQADTVRNFWYDYYSFYYRDPDYADATYSSPHKYGNRASFNWGYSPKATVGYNNANGTQPYQYIQAIRIYSLFQKNFSEYQLINPTISKFDHGQHDASEGQGLMTSTMTVQFETVKYYSGQTTANTAGGFIDLHYDNQSSPISPLEGTDLIDNGIGGVSHASPMITDLASINFLNTTVGTMLYNNSTGITNVGAANMAGGVSYSTFNGGMNAGGFSLPNLGNLPIGISGTGLLSQTSATFAGVAGSITSQASNAVIGGIAAGLGPNGNAIIGLVAQGISNPTLLINTAENMAVNLATSYAAQKLQEFVTPYINQLGTTISSATSEYITAPLKNLWSTGSEYITYLGQGGADTGLTFTQFQNLPTDG